MSAPIFNRGGAEAIAATPSSPTKTDVLDAILRLAHEEYVMSLDPHEQSREFWVDLPPSGS